MRLIFYILGGLFSISAISIIFTNIASKSSDLIGYGAASAFSFYGICLLTAAIRNYLGGLRFLFGAIMLSFCVFLIFICYNDFLHQHTENFRTGLIVTSFFLHIGLILVWLGHKQHKKNQTLLESRKAEAALKTSEKYGEGLTGQDVESGEKFPEFPFYVLYPPMQTWRIFLLLIYSGMFYAIFLTYRILKDLQDMGEIQFKPKRDAAKMLIPIYGLIVFLRIAQSLSKLAKSKGIANEIKPSNLVWLLVLTELSGILLPRFLSQQLISFPLALLIACTPWLILHKQMNKLRLAYASNWREPAYRYNWKQLGILLIGIPVMGWVLYSNKIDLSIIQADRLEAGQIVSGLLSIYQLKIPDKNWKQLPLGTLYKDTNIELINRPTNEWVVVRITPKLQQSLDNVVDQRRTIIATHLQELKIDETRTLDSSIDMTPVSWAHYSGNEGPFSIKQSIYVETVISSGQVVEVIGRGSTNSAGSAKELVKSLHLTVQEGKK